MANDDMTSDELERHLVEEARLDAIARADFAARLRQVEYALADMSSRLPSTLREVRAIRAELTRREE